MAQAYTSPDWASGEGISPSNLQSISNVLEGIVQGTDKAIHNFSISGSNATVTFVDGTTETFAISGLKGIASVTKTTSGLVDTYTITYTDGTTYSFTVTNGDGNAASDITYDNSTTGMTAENVQDALDEVFQSVGDGKELIADAITDKGITTSATDTFQTMATNISNISGGGSGTDVSDTTATASDVLSGKIFHTANGSRTTGTLVVPNVKSGTFTLTSSDQTINCGFQPTQVTVYEGIGDTTWYGIGTIINGTNYGLRYGTSSSTNKSPCVITLTSNGFKVKSDNSSYNKSSKYIAIG